ncbi:MAG: protein kinase domain-containing protein, partial [Planctomycetota bacterium]
MVSRCRWAMCRSISVATHNQADSPASSSMLGSAPSAPMEFHMTDPCCDPLIGRHLCDYHLEAPLGVGGMGAVYRATNTRLGNQVAVKVLAAHLAADQEYLGRFEREARSLAQLNHPNIVPLHDFGDSDGLRYLVMAYMDRGSLKDRIQTHGRLAPTEVVSIVRDVLKGLAHAHGKGFVHRDIKPSNILLDDQGNARLVDFGLVKQTGDAGLSLTLTGEAMGTPHYMAPEQWDNAPPDPRMDLWAVGVTAYHALTGQVPFGGTGPTQIVKAISLHEPAPLKAHGLTAFPALQAFLDRLLAKEPQDRFASADAALAALDELATGKQSAPPEASGDALDRTVKARPGVVGGAPPPARPGGGPRARGSRPPSRAGARVLVVFLLLAGLGGVGAGGWWWWQQQVAADAAAWSQAQQTVEQAGSDHSRAIAALEGYLSARPALAPAGTREAAHDALAQAQARLALREAWDETQAEAAAAGDPDAALQILEAFRAAHPQALFGKEISAAIGAAGEAVDARDWQQAQAAAQAGAEAGDLEQIEAAYARYLDRHDRGMHAEQARGLRVQARRRFDAVAWESAQRQAAQAEDVSAGKVAYRGYLDAWPQGQYRSQAQAAWNALDAEDVEPKVATLLADNWQPGTQTARDLWAEVRPHLKPLRAHLLAGPGPQASAADNRRWLSQAYRADGPSPKGLMDLLDDVIAESRSDRSTLQLVQVWLLLATCQGGVRDGNWPLVELSSSDAGHVAPRERLEAYHALAKRENIPRAARAQVERAEAAEAAGDLSAAMAAWREAQPALNDHYGKLAAEALARIQRAQVDAAIAQVRATAKAAQESGDAGLALAAWQEFDPQAIAAYAQEREQQLVALRQAHFQQLYEATKQAHADERWQDGLEALEQALAYDPDNRYLKRLQPELLDGLREELRPAMESAVAGWDTAVLERHGGLYSGDFRTAIDAVLTHATALDADRALSDAEELAALQAHLSAAQSALPSSDPRLARWSAYVARERRGQEKGAAAAAAAAKDVLANGKRSALEGFLRAHGSQPAAAQVRAVLAALPRWAAAGGEDQYGRWAVLEVGAVAQRLRWIAPGRFQMGSPGNESGR